jgi:hypothetical protein
MRAAYQFSLRAAFNGKKMLRSSEVTHSCKLRVKSTYARQDSGAAGLPPIADDLVWCDVGEVSEVSEPDEDTFEGQAFRCGQNVLGERHSGSRKQVVWPPGHVRLIGMAELWFGSALSRSQHHASVAT